MALRFLFLAFLLLTGCDQIYQRLGLEDIEKKEATQDGEGRAVGSACRQAGRAIEDCYSIYYWLPKASIFAGWRDMNDYMQSNDLKVVVPVLPPPSSEFDSGSKANRKSKTVTATAPPENKETKPETAEAPKADKQTAH